MFSRLERSIDFTRSKLGALGPSGRCALLVALLWLVLFAVPMIRDPYFHPPLTLRIMSSQPAERSVVVAWDRGSGFNDHEAKPLVLPPAKGPGPFTGVLEMSIDGSRNPASESIEAWITGFRVQSGGAWKDVKLDELERRADAVVRGDVVILTAKGGALVYNGTFERAEIIAGRQRYSGILQVRLDRQLVETVDLYHPTGAEARVSVASPNPAVQRVTEFKLPRQFLSGVRVSAPEALKVSAIVIADEAGRELRKASYTGGEKSLTIPMAELNQSVLTSPLLVFRLVAATLLAGLFAMGYAAFKNLAVGHSSRLFMIRHQGRAVFWAPFALLLAWYATWVAGQWPGFPTFDTYEQLMQGVMLTFSNWNPFVHTLLLNAVYDAFRSLGAVSSIQAVATAGLMTFALYSFWRRGAPIWLVGSAFLLLVASPVTAIYNLQPWRDIPFSLLTIFWALLLFHLCLAKGDPELRPSLPATMIVVLGALLFLVATVRHNGQVFLGLIPLILFAGRLLPWRQIVGVTVVGGILYGLTFGPLARFYDVYRSTNYNLVSLSVILNPLIGLMKTSYGPQSETWGEDMASVSAIADPEALKNGYNPLHVLQALGVPRKVPLTGPEGREQMARLERAFIRLALQNPQVFLSERLHLFLATIAFRNQGGWSSSLWMPDRPSRFLPQGDLQELYKIHRSPLLTAFDALQTPILARVNNPSPLATWVVYFSAFIPFCFALALLVLAWRFPAAAVANLLIVVQCGVLFLASVGHEFRFFYFLYLYGFLAVPMVAAEYATQRRRERERTHSQG